MKRRLLSISFFFVLILPLFFMGSVFYYQKKQIKKEVKHMIIDGIDKNDLVKIEVSQLESVILFDWKHSKEFEYKNEMYDIVFKERNGDQIIFYLWWDNKETQLNKKLASLLNEYLGNHTNRNNNKFSYYQILKSLYFEEYNQDENDFKEVIKPNFHYLSFYSNNNILPTTPPPRNFG